jgi:1-deoxy-D-xylulose-5-phosphate reductoisomerase
VAAYLQEQIAFHAIADVIRGTMEAHSPREVDNIDDALDTDRWAREKAGMLIRSLAPSAVR